MVGLAALADFGPVQGSEIGARNGQERVEYGRNGQFGWLAKSAGIRTSTQGLARAGKTRAAGAAPNVARRPGGWAPWMAWN